jgi:antitoxin component of MazEF toxin-antitoxin module
MTKRTRVVRANHRLAVVLPRSAVQALAIRAGDSVEVMATNGTVVIRPARRSASLRTLIRRITPKNRHGETRWDAGITGREIW